MDGVLEVAAALCVCKLVCSLLFLPSVTASFNPVSFCCCCLLIFTDVLVTIFLTFLWIAESWLPQLSLLSDVIALRSVLFLSHTYGAVLLLTTPLIATETVVRLLWPHTHRTAGEEGCDGRLRKRSYVSEVTMEEEEDQSEERDTDKDCEKGRSMSHAIGYLCCLSVWLVVGLNVRWGWRLEEVWAAVCIHANNSLIVCLPNLLSGPMPHTMDPCWSLAFLALLLLLMTLGTGLHRRQQAPANTVRTSREKHGADNSSSNSGWQHLVPALSAPSKTVHPGMSASEPAQSVDPEKTQSSCTVHRAYSWSSVQMSACHHGDFVLLSPECLFEDRGGQEHGRTKGGIPLPFIMEEHTDSTYRSGWRQWGFPCPGVNAMTGFVGVLSVFVLPLNLSVNIVLIRTIEITLELCIEPLVVLRRDFCPM